MLPTSMPIVTPLRDTDVAVQQHWLSPTSLPRALVTAQLQGPGFAKLRELAYVVYNPWIGERDQTPLKLYNTAGQPDRTQRHRCGGRKRLGRYPGLLPGMARRTLHRSPRGDPTNVDIPDTIAAGIPVLNTLADNADAVTEMAVTLWLTATRHLLNHICEYLQRQHVS